jgi:DNA-binding IclR family transcriptional regulator
LTQNKQYVYIFLSMCPLYGQESHNLIMSILRYHSKTIANIDDTALGKSLQKGLAIIEAVSRAEGPSRIAELTIGLGISRPTVHRVVQTLIAQGYLTQDPTLGRLSVGLSVFPLSASVLNRNRLRLEALPHLQSLATLTGERANLGVLYRNRIFYLAGVEKPTLPMIYTYFGKFAPAHCCSLGKAIMAFLPEEDVRAVLTAEPLNAHTLGSITDPQSFFGELTIVRRRGYATDNEEHIIGSCCVASPVFDPQNRAVGAIGVSGRSLLPLLNHVDAVQRTAELISHVL